MRSCFTGTANASVTILFRHRRHSFGTVNLREHRRYKIILAHEQNRMFNEKYFQGNVGEMVTNMNAAKAAFEEQMDGVKQYMEHRKVNQKLQRRIVKWFRYIWGQGQSLDEDTVMDMLPAKLRAEVAMHVHLETLKRVKLFQVPK